MSEPLRADLFVEDVAHQKLLAPLIWRIAQEENSIVQCQIRSARGGHPRAIQEFKLYQQSLTDGFLQTASPDLLVVAIDSNCSTLSQTRDKIIHATSVDCRHLLVCACPDPHIERWYMADIDSFHRVIGYQPRLGRVKCERDYYKQVLGQAIKEGGHPAPLGGIEFASELAKDMNLYQAGKNDASLKAFLDDLRKKLRMLATTR